MKILVVDDSKAMRMIIARALRQAGLGAHAVLQAASGAEALEAIAREAPDVVLADWNMPEMSGLELLQRLRAEGSAVPFGFVTSEGTGEMRLSAHEAGARFLVAKPFTPEALREALGPILG